MKTEELIAKFKQAKKLKTNEEVAYALKIDAGNLSSITNEKKPMPVAMKFKLLQHIEYSPDIGKIAACFLDIKEHLADVQADIDRIEEIKKKGQPVHKKYTNQNEIDRINELMRKRKIDVEQTAKLLETTHKHLEGVLSGDNVLSVTSKAMLYIANTGNSAIKKFIDLMPISEATKKAWRAANDEVVHKNLNTRLKK